MFTVVITQVKLDFKKIILLLVHKLCKISHLLKKEMIYPGLMNYTLSTPYKIMYHYLNTVLLSRQEISQFSSENSKPFGNLTNPAHIPENNNINESIKLEYHLECIADGFGLLFFNYHLPTMWTRCYLFLKSLKVMSTTFLLVCCSSQKESNCATWKSIFYFKALFISEKIKY